MSESSRMSTHKALELADKLRDDMIHSIDTDLDAADTLVKQHAKLQQQRQLIVQMREALTVGLEAAQELLAMKREALGDDDYAKTRSYWETEREVCAAITAADQYLKDNP